jgi:hypothetical protein
VRVGALLGRLLAGLLLVAGSVAAAIWLLGGSDPSGEMKQTAAEPTRAKSVTPISAAQAPAADQGGAPETGPSRRTAKASPRLLRADAATSWEGLSQSTPGQLGLVVAPFNGGKARAFGSLRSRHAWSTIKVPILVTRLHEGSLTSEEEDWAREVLTASDNEAAASLFGSLEATHGGLDGASQAVGATLRRAGDDSTMVATAPPPSGAVSTFGQTIWSLRASTEFFAALGRDCLLNPDDTEYVLSLMEEVIPEQRWGLGEAAFPPMWRVAFKGGWGPEGSASGPYLVRQSGLLSYGGTGVAVAMIAQADSGSFEAGVEAIDGIANWLAAELRGLGTSARPC